MIAGPARADSLQLLGPTGPVSPEPFAITVVRRDDAGAATAPRKLRVTVEGGDLRDAPSDGPLISFEIAPSRGAREVRVRAVDEGLSAVGTFPVGPPSTQVQLTLDPPAPVKGRDREAVLTVRVGAAKGEAEVSPPVLRANVGKIEGLERIGAGEYRARYVLPETRYPEVAIVVAFSAWPHPDSVHGAVGRMLVPLATSIELPGRTEPNAQMSLEIAGKTYGPVTSDPTGRFRVPVVVPPGHRFAQGLAVDRAGNRRRTKIDLLLPPTDQLACVVNPQRLPADGEAQARVVCAASDPYGKPVGSKGISLTARRGTLSAPKPNEQGMVEWLYTAPRELGPADPLVATWRQGRQSWKDELSIALVQGPVAKLELTSEEELVHRGGAVDLRVRLFDATARPRPDVAPQLSASGAELGPPKPTGPGGWEVLLSAPLESELGTLDVRATAFGPSGQGPAQLSVWRRGEALVAGVFDLAGWPVADQPLLLGARPLRTGADGRVVLGPITESVELRHGEWPGLRRMLHVVDGRVAPLDAPRDPPEGKVTLRLGPPVPVNVRLQVRGGELSYWVEDSRGRVLPNRRVLIAFSSGERIDAVTTGRRGVVRFPSADAAVSVADVATGVTAVTEGSR